MDTAFWDGVADIVSAVLLLLGAFLAFAAGVGVVRFPDLLARMHAATKPQVLGLILVLLGLSLRLRSWGAVATLALVVVFQLLTSPVAAHMVGRAGYRTGKVDTSHLVVDELTRDQDAADREDVGEHDLPAGRRPTADLAGTGDAADHGRAVPAPPNEDGGRAR
ncbi:monovalent cation/H(+) antiporter subunit G [Cellulosimicrobium sp. Marseille-Q4280]|uniref:monovalent cation/H(+) antiporter subunit G n=1 Tax=Cellulosimicrobium sp. Marseille-Q4280 TaxID=2937992 RepID=UPI00203F06F6|nr:monovalent cation/H(+) antiporter subunit G [Cellulosimicrobium sp. Marseille-Q4280]